MAEPHEPAGQRDPGRAGLDGGRGPFDRRGGGGARAFSNGVVLDIAVRARTRPDDPNGLFATVLDEPGPDSLLLNVEFADSRTTAGPAGAPTADDLPDESPLLFQGGGHGSDVSVETSYFLTPMPPPGPVTLHCAWPSAGIAATRTEFDGTVLADAQRRVEVLWPLEAT